MSIRTSRPSVALNRCISQPSTFIVPAAAYQRLGDLKRDGRGGEPYQLDRFEVNINVRFVRNPDFWNSGAEGGADTIESTDVQSGLPVDVVLEDIADGIRLPKFRPVN